MTLSKVERELDQTISQFSERTVHNFSRRNLHLTTAESCTGGMIFSRITEIPGASVMADCGFITYSDEAKIKLLGVPAGLIGLNGAVSEATAGAMASGALFHSPNANVALSVTGIAGPGGGSVEKPVGTVFFGFGVKSNDGSVRIFVEKQVFKSEEKEGDLRRFIRMSSVCFALEKINQLLGAE